MSETSGSMRLGAHASLQYQSPSSLHLKQQGVHPVYNISLRTAYNQNDYPTSTDSPPLYNKGGWYLLDNSGYPVHRLLLPLR